MNRIVHYFKSLLLIEHFLLMQLLQSGHPGGVAASR